MSIDEHESRSIVAHRVGKAFADAGVHVRPLSVVRSSLGVVLVSEGVKRVNRNLTLTSLRGGFAHTITPREIHQNLLEDGHWQDPPFPIDLLYERLNLRQGLFEGAVGAHVLSNVDLGEVLLRRERDPRCVRFDMAFGLGRLLTGRRSACYVDLIDHENVTNEQHDAHRFACDLLMPEWSIRVNVDRCPRSAGFIAYLAPLYQVSELAMWRRLEDLYA